MLNPARLLAEQLSATLFQGYRQMFGRPEPDHAPLIRSMTELVMERLADSDALYHDGHHTACVTLVGEAILRGRSLVDEVTPEDWLHFIIALLCHDIGYLRGICPGDGDGTYCIDEAGHTVEAPRGASDAFLSPYHVERSKIFIRRRGRSIPGLDVERVAAAIELTRFPVPNDEDHADTTSEAGLVRAADLIGQLGDPYYPRKLNALFHEFTETGVAAKLGYASPADLAEHYPKFFWNAVEPYVGPALGHLQRTLDGKRWIAHLYAHVFVEEHQRPRAGPERQS
jgi:hypothetical protein